ncbi:MAG: large-conductance mechanosensitive channel protein MscL [Oscillospiraceae bacterium]|nr:large-conductance mechanosensitive channel protein MscL [Oscillospiraceae bacterium]
MRKHKKNNETTNLKKFLQEFKEFAVKGNMIDLAVGIIVGGAFSAVVNSVVTNLVTPLIGILIGVDFKEWAIKLPKLYGNAEPGTLAIGTFLNSVISFIVIAFIVFVFVKAINKFRIKQQPKSTSVPQSQSSEELLLIEIRDLLSKKQNP